MAQGILERQPMARLRGRSDSGKAYSMRPFLGQASFLLVLFLATISVALPGQESASPPNALAISLMTACERGDLEAVKQLLDRGADPNTENDAGETALMLAAQSGNQKVLAILIDKGASPERAISLGKDKPKYAALLTGIGSYYFRSGAYNKALPLYQEALAARRALDGEDSPDYVRSLDRLGATYYRMMKYDQALSAFQESLVIRKRTQREMDDDYANCVVRIVATLVRLGAQDKAISVNQEALVARENTSGKLNPIYILLLGNLGNIYFEAGAYDKALLIYQEVLLLQKEVLGESDVDCLYNVGVLLRLLGAYDRALPVALEAAERYKTAKGENSLEYARGLNGLGSVYASMGAYDKALPLYREAVVIVRKSQGTKDAQYASYLNDLAWLYCDMGSFADAVPLYQEALAVLEGQLGHGSPEYALSLNNLGLLYWRMHAYDKALPLIQESLEVRKRTRGDSHPEYAQSLESLGLVYGEMGELEKAIVLQKEAQRIYKAHGGETRQYAITLAAQGNLYLKKKDYAQATKMLKRSREIFLRVEDPSSFDNIVAVNNIGRIHLESGKVDEAIPLFLKAMAMVRENGTDKGLREAAVLDSLMEACQKSNRMGLAVLYGKQSVNLLQIFRHEIGGMDTELQFAFRRGVEETYRRLADVLISQGRLPEAQQVLDLLKDKELSMFLRGQALNASGNSSVEMTQLETQWRLRYEDIGGRVGALGQEKATLEASKIPTEEQKARLRAVKADLEVAQKAFAAFLEGMQKDFAKAPRESGLTLEGLRDLKGLQRTLRELGPGTVLLATVVSEERTCVLLTTPDFQKAGETSIASAELAKKVAAFREALRSPVADPRPLGQELYKILVSPLAKDLEQCGAKRMIWMLDGVLRYIPMAALYDGKAYLAERFPCVVATQASLANLKDRPTAEWTALGLGVSKAHGDLSELPAVVDELKAVVREEGSPDGAVPGRVLLDEAFTADSLSEALQRRDPVVHISSHFVFRPGGDASQSYLLLGDGKALTLADIQSGVSFDGVDLLTLSACQTAVGGGDQAGREVDGLGRVAQQNGAKAVLATLWPVADESTALLMADFYRRRQAHPELGKAEALRESQVALLRGELGGTAKPGPITEKGQKAIGSSPEDKAPKAKPFIPDERAPFAHPFFWAPFILIGNGQ